MVFVFVIHTVNNVGMSYSENFAYFLEIPDAEQVRFAIQMSFSEDWMIYFYLPLVCLFWPENHSDCQLQHAVCPSGKIYLVYI